MLDQLERDIKVNDDSKPTTQKVLLHSLSNLFVSSASKLFKFHKDDLAHASAAAAQRGGRMPQRSATVGGFGSAELETNKNSFRGGASGFGKSTDAKLALRKRELGGFEDVDEALASWGGGSLVTEWYVGVGGKTRQPFGGGPPPGPIAGKKIFGGFSEVAGIRTHCLSHPLV